VLLDFDPWLRIGTFAVRWEAVALGLTIGLCLVLFGRMVRSAVGRVRTDDVVFVVLAALPGAVVGGRLVHGLDFLDAYASQPMALLDLGRGSLSLVGAVAGGVLTASYVCRLLGHPPGRWLDAAAIPLLLGIGLGKLAMLLGGAGLGAAYSAPWAISFGGAGGWASAAASTPSHPSQVYEGLWALAGALLLIALTRQGTERWHGSGRRFLAAIAWWLAGRFVIAFTWRDERTAGPFGTEQLATLLLLLAAFATLPLVSRVRARRSGYARGRAAAR
jgi:prolipoprotein diacylglyceryltransferase